MDSVQPASPTLPPRNLIRVLTGFAVLMNFGFILSLTLDKEWMSSILADLPYSFIDLLLLFGAVFFIVRWTCRILRQPSAKTDRLILLNCIFWTTSILFALPMGFLPEAFPTNLLTAFLCFWAPVTFWIYRKLEAKWTTDQEIYPLKPGVTWPADRHFFLMACFFFWTACTRGIVSLNEYLPENAAVYYGTFLPMILTILIYQFGKRLLN